MSWYSIVRRGGTTTTLWDPSIDANVVGWWDTSALTTADTVTNGNGDESLLEWYDSISSIRAATYDSPFRDDHGPILVAGTQNGNAILEQATISSLFGGLSTHDLGGTGTFTEVTFVSVSRNTSPGTTGLVYSGPLMMSIRDGAGKFARIGWSDSGSGQVATTTRRPGFFTSEGDTRYAPGALVSDVDDWQIYSAAFNLGTGDCELFVNGTSHDTTTFATPVGSISKSTARLSVFGNTSYDFYRKSLNGSQGGEFVFAQSIDATLRQKAEGHLAHKWGLTANLPVGHPYKTTAPTT